VLEDNVHDLLVRLQKELRIGPAAPTRLAPAGDGYVPSERQLEAVLDIWRAKGQGA
jgi:hypothetical protein